MATEFNPADYFSLAQTLLSQSKGDDAQLRSALSRAYYSAFVTARDHAGVSSVGKDGHARVISYYKDNAANFFIAQNLEQLKRLRERADYQPKMACSNNDGQSALALCRKVLSRLGAAPSPQAAPVPAKPPASAA